MKRRTGLVSNSSSSSFMCTFGKVIDEEAFARWCKDTKVTIKTLRGREIKATPSPGKKYNDQVEDFFKESNGDFFDLMPSRADLESQMEEEPDTLFAMAGGCGYEDDSFYWDGSEYDYDRAEDDSFPAHAEALAGAGKEEGFQEITSTLYAGRDG